MRAGPCKDTYFTCQQSLSTVQAAEFEQRKLCATCSMVDVKLVLHRHSCIPSGNRPDPSGRERAGNSGATITNLPGRIRLGVHGAHGRGAGFQFSGRRAALHFAKKKSAVLKDRGHVGVIRAQGLLPNR